MRSHIDRDFNSLLPIGRKYLVSHYNANNFYIHLKCISHLYCVSLKEILSFCKHYHGRIHMQWLYRKKTMNSLSTNEDVFFHTGDRNVDLIIYKLSKYHLRERSV